MPRNLSFYWKRKNILSAGFVILFAAVGVIILFASHAATPYAAIEAETGATGGATSVSDSKASNGSYLQFGTEGGSTGSGGTAPALPSGVSGTFVGSETGAQMYTDSAWQKSTNGDLSPSSGCTDTAPASITVSGTYLDLYTPASNSWDCAGVETSSPVEPGHIYQLREYIPALANGNIADYPAWWTTDAPWDNEIDMAEAESWGSFTGNLPGAMCFDIHLDQGTENTSANCQTEAAGWHVYTMVWNANGNVTMYYDGTKMLPLDGPTASTGTSQYMIIWNDNSGATGTVNSTVQIGYLATWTTN